MAETMRLATDERARALPKKVGFTVAVLDVAACPAGKGRTWLYDTRQPGLAFMITEAGSKAFYSYRKVNGRPERVRLGGWPEITIDQARKLAAGVTAKIAQGINPQQEKREARGEATFEAVFNKFMEQHAKLKKRSWEKDQQRYDTHLAAWKNRKASTITRHDVQSLHATIGKDAPGAANRVLALLSTVFNVVLPDIPNPTKGVKRFREVERERFLTATEMQRLFTALKKQPQLWQDFFELCLWTGARSGNVKEMEWAEIDMEGKTWRIPGEKFKSGKELVVPLVDQAMTILARRLKEREESPYVFPSKSKTGHITEPKTAWKAILADAEMSGVWIHDLRRTSGTWMTAGGAPLSVVSKALGHTNASTTARYARTDIDVVREAMNATATLMKAASTGRKARKTKGGSK